MVYPAHIRAGDGAATQSVEKHCRACARYAALAAPLGLEKTAYLAGLLHDMGKYTNAFATYITQAASGQAVQKGSVNHTFAGVRFVLQRWRREEADFNTKLTSEILAYALGAHHGQFDCIAPDGSDGFAHRVSAQGTGFEEASANFLSQCAGEEELDTLFRAAVGELAAAQKVLLTFVTKKEEMYFHLGLLARQIAAGVMEGDRRDTREFMDGKAPDLEQTPCWKNLLARVEQKIFAMPDQGKINRARREISDQCCQAAGRGPGNFQLSVPTGGGKTLTALRYTLAEAHLGHKKRIFFITPLLSVLEQNAKIIRESLAQDDLVLEHHSNVVREKSGEEALDSNELLMENWQKPIVITTLVQLLNTLFAGQTSCIRRMQALSNSVIVLDEVQSVPKKMLSQFNMAMNYLAGFCGATVVHCSATQPCLEKADYPLRLGDAPQLVPYDRGALSPVYLHVPQHRIKALAEINQALDEKQPIICVSTQLVEAGVDFSFGCVIRLAAGMDNVIQAAGRCNRGGEKGKLCPVYIAKLKGEKLDQLPEIRQAQNAALSLLIQYERTPGDFGEDLAGSQAIATYYKTLYAEMPKHGQNYPLAQYKSNLVELLSTNSTGMGHWEQSLPAGEYTIRQAFRTAGEAFKVFEENTVDVLVPYGEGQRLIEQLASSQGMHNYAYRAALVQRAGRYSVALYDHEIQKLRDVGGIHPLAEGSILALDAHFYHGRMGVQLGGGQLEFAEV